MNATGRLAAPPFELLECLDLCGRVHAATNGLFDPAVQPLWALYATHYSADDTVSQKGGKIGPNLFGVVGRAVGSVPDVKYDEFTAALGAAGAVWDEANLAAYLADPGAWLKEASGDQSAKSNMTFKLAKGGEDMAACLATQK